MGSNYIAEDAVIRPSIACVYDSSLGFSADFSRNGDVDGWEYFDGIHTYGCWAGFLFGTLYGEYGIIGRYNVFMPINAITHYFLRIVMKYNPIERDSRGNHPLPTRAKVRWRTLSNTNWGTDKEKYFDIEADNKWHTYILNMGVEQWWQGDINDLRIWPAVEHGADGDEFFIRAIEIFSSEIHECRNTACDKFSEYSHPCPWIGTRATCESEKHEDDKKFTVSDLSELIVNINDYGNEIVKIKEAKNVNGQTLANKIAKAISRTNVGGYAEVFVEYTENNTFKIYSGTTTSGSSVRILDNELARYLKFFAIDGSDISIKTTGADPASGYSPLSNFKINTYQVLNLFDGDDKTSILFNPFQYSVEAGRRDWLESSIGLLSASIGNNDGDISGQVIRKYYMIRNKNKTIIDYNHPFNASGKIKKIWIMCSLDDPNYVKTGHEKGGQLQTTPTATSRKGLELSGAKVMIMRPRRDGTMQAVYEWDLHSRDPDRTYNDALYSLSQEQITLDVNVFVNKGDLLAVYNANMYIGKSISGYEYDCQFFQISGKPEIGEIFEPGMLNGDGSAGLLLYANSTETQQRLLIDIDLQHRYNLENIILNGDSLNSILEYNVARCLDINWQCDLFGKFHWTRHRKITAPGEFWYQRYNVYYGLDKLNDGVYIVQDGLACDSYYITTDNSSSWWNYNAGPGIVPINPKYFWVNGDEEWLGVWLHAQWFQTSQAVLEFDHDPIAIYLHFPFEKKKRIYKSKIYFKEKFNFRSFALSAYQGFYYTSGDADDMHYDLIPEYTEITLDNVAYNKTSPTYDMIGAYLFRNPCTGHMIAEATSSVMYEWDPIYSDMIEDYTGQSGYFTYQTLEVSNADEWEAARRIDWQIITHEWDPIEASGFRIYCNFHKSTKITEMELYCAAEDVGSSLAGSIITNFSYYGDYWWPTESVQNSETEVEIFIGDSPRYLSIELTPITETTYKDVIIYVKKEDLYSGEKGCEYIYYTPEAKIDATNESQIVEVKNVYEHPYDLYIDIAPGKLIDRGLLFFSRLNNAESIVNPIIGPDANYHKLFDYPILNQDYNCAINCHTFGLNNLIDGAKSYYSYDDMWSWNEYKILEHGKSIGFENLPDGNRTTIFLPILSRSRYWKFGHLNEDISTNIKEIRAYDSDDNLLDPDFYHDLNKTYTDGGVSERAPHLENISVVGSYYTITKDQYITLDLHDSIALKKLEIYHTNRADYDNTYAGIDRYTKLCARGTKDHSGVYARDYSYYNKNINFHGSATVETTETKSYRYNISLADFACSESWYFSDSYGSTFSGTCGTPTVSGSYYFDLACNTKGTDGIWHDLMQTGFDDTSGIVWQGMPFEMGAKINITSASGSAVSCLGLVGDKVEGWHYYDRYLKYYSGVQLAFDAANGNFVLAVRHEQDSYDESKSGQGRVTTQSVSGFSLNTDYYCIIYSDGVDANPAYANTITYRAKVWTDGFNGSNLIADLTRTINYRWRGTKVGFGSAWAKGASSSDRITQHSTGTISNFYFNLNAQIKEYPFYDSNFDNRTSIRIPSGSSNYVSIPFDSSLLFKQRRYTIDFWVKFNSLPAIGERVFLVKNWKGSSMGDGSDKCFAIALYNVGLHGNGYPKSYYRLEYWICNGTDAFLIRYTGHNGDYYTFPMAPFYPQIDRWYHIICQNAYTTSTTEGKNYNLDIDARTKYVIVNWVASKYNLVNHDDNIEIGAGNFDGWIQEVRISRGDDNTILTSSAYGGNRYTKNGDFVPVKLYETLYTFSFYVSDTNLNFGHYADVDSMFEYPEYYYVDGSIFADLYNSYLAIDLGHRYKLDLIRRYGANDDYYIDRDSNILYSNIDTADPDIAFDTEITFDPDDSFYSWDSDLIDKEKWYVADNLFGQENTYLVMKHGRLEQLVNSTISDSRFYSTYGIRGNFDIEIKCDTTDAPDIFSWYILFRVDFTNGENGETYVNSRISYRSDNGYPYYRVEGYWSEDGTLYSENKVLSAKQSGLRIIREHNIFYIKYFEGGIWKDLEDKPLNGTKGKDVVKIHIGLVCSNNYPTTKVYWSDFKINDVDTLIYRSTYEDARWLAIEILNGDGYSRYLKKLGVYPNIQISIAPDAKYHNSSWTDLGPSITAYSTGQNVALGATVSGSSYIGDNSPNSVTNGLIDNELTHAWLSDNSSEQWLKIDLGEEKQIYRVKVYHGYSTNDSDFLIQDYRIESSIDGITYTTQWNISGNSSFTRTHDKADPFTARYIRMYITDYKHGSSIYIKKANGIDFYIWKGACLREIEVYEYYGFEYISSEEWPIIAINLRDQFYIQGHSLVGLYAENSSMDWSNDDSNFCWSDNVIQEPEKITFNDWGQQPNYEQWVAIKRDTATYHNITPNDPVNYPPSSQAYGIDYLKHAIIKTTSKENPVDYPWWWSSTISTLSRDFSMPVEISTSSLRIDYPASSVLDTVQFIEGSNWGVDSDQAYRDGLGFRWYIEDVSKLDTSEGYVFFGGVDGTDTHQPVVYRWYLSTLSGTTALQTGWNRPYFRFKNADEIVSNEDFNLFDKVKPLMREYTTWKTCGIKFKGKGEAFQMNLDGFVIQRNHFQDSSKFDYGLYLNGPEYLDFPFGELDLAAGTIEFWLRTDYNSAGLDEFSRFKNRSLFHFGNVAGDVFGCMINSEGINVYYGNVGTDLRALVIKGVVGLAVDSLFHIAVAFSANGKNLDSDGSTIKLYINNNVVATNYDIWSYSDDKLFKFTFGSKAPFGLIEHASSLETTSINGVMSNLRIYNYCKSDYTDSMTNDFSETTTDDLLIPSKMIEISKDNLTFYKVGDPELPFFYEKVPAGDTVKIYVRTILPDDLTGKEDRTAGIVTSWDIGV